MTQSELIDKVAQAAEQHQRAAGQAEGAGKRHSRPSRGRTSQFDDALAWFDRYNKDGWKIAGGKGRVKRPKAVIDISGIVAL
jgi:hypothetical protein